MRNGLLALALTALWACPSTADSLAALPGESPSGAQFGQRECAVPESVARISGTLPRSALRLRDEAPLRIVAIGSSSTQGVGASSQAQAYPALLQEELTRRFPMSRISVANKGVGGELAHDMVARMESDAIDRRPNLVIWQTGTNDAIRGIPTEGFLAELRDGVTRLRQANIDVLIVDPQYTPRVAAGGGSAMYIDLFATLSRELDVAVFHRQAIMRHWVQAGRFSFSTMLSADRFHMNDRSYHCLALVLADAIERAVRD